MWSDLGTADRGLGSDTRARGPVRVLVVEKTYDATRAEVWHAISTSERLARWLAPVTGDLALGGRFQVEGNAGGQARAAAARCVAAYTAPPPAHA